MNTLVTELKQLIIDTLDLEDIAPADINASEPLFGAGLGLDSIDALELGVAIQKKYQIKLATDAESNRQHFSSVDSLAAFISTQQPA
ncbi:MAG TPA: phosphopantetheine-binding protein [Gammaproteobacteria bacterium]|nr:phosphopantetheine-binding protein [Gammaproteobacteria bacterium]